MKTIPLYCIVNKSDSVCAIGVVRCLFFTLCFANFKMHSKLALYTMFNKLSRILFILPFSLDICQKFCINVITSMYGFDFGVVACADAMDPPSTHPQCEPIHVLPPRLWSTHTHYLHSNITSSIICSPRLWSTIHSNLISAL